MKQKHYYKNAKAILSHQSKWASNVYYAFPIATVNLHEIAKLIDDGVVDNHIKKTRAFLILSERLEKPLGKMEKNSFQKMRMIEGVVVFSPMSYQEYNVTATAKAIIEGEKIFEKNFSSADYISVHNEKLSIETVTSSLEVSTRLHNLNCNIDDMCQERINEIEKQIIDFIA